MEQGEVIDMGMKSKSAHFPPKGQGGNAARASGGPVGAASNGVRPTFPKNDGQVKHMLRGGRGHLLDTPSNRNIIVTIASNEHNYVGTDKHGNRWYAKTVGGKQYWVQLRNCIIQNCGCNEPPRPDNQLFERKDKK